MNNPSRFVIVSGLGLTTSVFIAILLAFIDLRFGIAIYSFTAWLVIPIGALFSGLLGASGYYFGSRFLNYRPSRALLASIVAISTGIFFLQYWIQYTFLTIDGRAVSDVISYTRFLSLTLSHTAIQFRSHGQRLGEAVDLGWGSYPYAVLQVIGFALGGAATYFCLTISAYCEKCNLYLIDKGDQTRYFESIEDLNGAIKNVFSYIQASRVQQSIEAHALLGTSVPKSPNSFSLVIQIERCSGCETHLVKVRGYEWIKNEWKRFSELNHQHYCTEQLQIVPDFVLSNSSPIT